MKNIRAFFKRVQKKVELRRKLASFVSIISQKEILIGVGALVSVGLIVVLSIAFTINQDVDVVGWSEQQEDVIRHPLTGEILSGELSELPQVFGVMVENSADAWPLSGLDQAFLVIEAPVEASIPRFIAFFSEDQAVDKIGPVRSARPYYIDWNDGLQAIYAHVGGSPEALELIKNTFNTFDLNQFWNADYFYRQNSTRYAPHNVYTSSQLLSQAMDDQFGDLENPEYDLWKFAPDAPTSNPKSITIDWTEGTTYDIGWMYQAQTNNYLRMQGSRTMKMEDGAVIETNNVAIISTDIRIIDNEGRRSIVTTGEGDALIVQNGEVFLARWKKDDHDDRLKFYTSDGYEISFNAGKTWIEIVSSLSQVEVE
ncbi:DUF3048 domain-containing protein [Patescibacteria group bacterium]|nr:DUF3048 domain-containing protein [Patescibacteria group bacterium]